MEKQRVQKFIALSGYCSRRKAEDLIKSGKVVVNDEVVSLGFQCFENAKILVNGKKIKVNFNFKYLILNKKKGYVCSKEDKFNKKTIYDLIKIKDNSLFSVGRLDKDTTGLIIITNDGQFNQRVIHPSKKIAKEYLVELNSFLSEKKKIELENGIILDGYKLKPCSINLVEKNKFKIIIFEGRKRQIRRMFEQVGLKVINLHRKKIGNLDLGNLKFGESLEVSKNFLEEKIFKNE